MNTRLLRLLRLIEGIILANVLLLIVFLLFVLIPLYLGLSLRVTASLFTVFLLCLYKFRPSLKKFFYVRLLPFMKPLWDYEQQRSVSDKSRRNERIVIAITTIGLIFAMIYFPPIPKPINWEGLKYSVSGSFIGVNVGMIWKTLTEKFD